jgi:hypothetical protein
MSAQAENYTLDDFISEDSTCASCSVGEDPDWSVPADSPVGRCLDLDQESNVCGDCFQEMSSVYRAGDSV